MHPDVPITDLYHMHWYKAQSILYRHLSLPNKNDDVLHHSIPSWMHHFYQVLPQLVQTFREGP